MFRKRDVFAADNAGSKTMKGEVMKRNIFLLVACCMMLMFAMNASAAEKGLVETVMEGCKAEMQTYCKDVTLGEGRMLACLYAHEDKLSGRCEYALYDAASRLEHAVAALKHAASECKTDLKKYCADVKPGEGRLVNCIDKHDKQVSSKCKQALKDTGLRK
jgi:hypothetical protein